MQNHLLRALRFIACASCCLIGTGCSFLPGFGLAEAPLLYYIDVAEVANQVACELQSFVAAHQNDPIYAQHTWVLSTADDAKVVLTLQTDESGYVNFTGIDASKFGFTSLASLIAATGTTKISSLGAKLTGKRARTVAITFSVSPKPLPKDLKGKSVTDNCLDLAVHNPITSLYLKDWLNNYFETLNSPGSGVRPDYDKSQESSTDALLRAIRPIRAPPPVPKQLKITTVELSTAFTLTVDLSAGAAPSVLGSATAFLIPINALALDYNPDYTHKIDLTLNICDSRDVMSCNPPHVDWAPPISLLQAQCKEYGKLNGILTVKPPSDYQMGANTQMRCSKDGIYRPIS